MKRDRAAFATLVQRFRELIGRPDLTDEQTIQAAIPYRDAYKEKN